VTAPARRWRPWREAWADALYGDGDIGSADIGSAGGAHVGAGFYRRPGAVRRHFRTAVTSAPPLATLFARLAGEVEQLLGAGPGQGRLRLGDPARFDVVDVGAGGGELLDGLAALGVPARWRLTGVEVGPRPAGVPDRVVWRDRLPERITGLVVAHEWLDNVPAKVVEQSWSGPRTVEVAPNGKERLGAPPTAGDAAWLDRWWPLGEPGDRAEVGRVRDEAWADVVRRIEAGLAVAIDYAADPARHRHGTLAAYRRGRAVRPVPDGSCDITAHVCFESGAAAGEAVGATATALLDQTSALAALGAHSGSPPAELAATDPAAYLTALAGAGTARELTDARGLGAFGWLVQAVGVPLPATLISATPKRPRAR
jgi:SAM-dependent MidA family methyltransferase